MTCARLCGRSVAVALNDIKRVDVKLAMEETELSIARDNIAVRLCPGVLHRAVRAHSDPCRATANR